MLIATLFSASFNIRLLSSSFIQALQAQHDLIFKNNIPIAEIIFKSGGIKDTQTPGSGAYSPLRAEKCTSALLIRQLSPRSIPIKACYWDVRLQVAIARFIRRMFRSALLEGIIEEESRPGLLAVPADAVDEVWANWLKDASNFHTIGTAAMMPRSVGGVVNNRMQVYDTANVLSIRFSFVDIRWRTFTLCRARGGFDRGGLDGLGTETGSGRVNEAFSYEIQYALWVIMTVL
ncbi:hypothetical protein CNMCM5793_007644 [Aspergillus hiratsukae]|uniref:Glucose-methanol-choline oxidoreductase C-terminal domain-containing protein n=1 Tax=Aspergillus hiratsukae TaxID=1194566 RepID=A0A8H6UM91_9EURO|nr:hypothetical protein CNMCM5793_007644 [Aspergillus hiratsukae]KAF7158350.1 hypothetical protein CNMCM6106_004846 [Aspergillus hiratsukae]